MPQLAIIHARHFKVHFPVAGIKGFRSKIKRKNVKDTKSRAWGNLICNLWKLFIYISNYYDSKHSSRRCFQGNNFHHQVTGFAHAFSRLFFFTFDNFLNFSELKGKICTQKLFNENGPFIENQYRVLGMRALTCLIP